MTLGEALLGAVIGIAFIGVAVFYALRTTGMIGPPRHDVRSGGDHADQQVRQRSYDDSDAGGSDGD